VMGVIIFFGMVATCKFRGEVLKGNADADVALGQSATQKQNIATWKAIMGFQAQGDLFGSDKCSNFVTKIVTQTSVWDYRAPLKSAKLVGKFVGPKRICVSMNRWDVYDLKKFKLVMYAKGNRIVAAITWQPTLKTGAKAPTKETDIQVYSFSGSKCSRVDVTFGNWINFDSVTGDAPKPSTNPRLNIATNMLKSWRTGKFHGSSCSGYWGSHFTKGAVLDPRGPTGAASSMTKKTIGSKLGCGFFAAVEKFGLTNLNDIFYMKGPTQVVQAQSGKISYGGSTPQNFCMSGMISTTPNKMITLYDMFWCKPATLDKLMG
jgi:hypothetical protein